MMANRYDWYCFLTAADEWFVTYSLPPWSFGTVKLFCLSHVVELYLKASYAKMTGSVERAVGCGHKIA